MHAPKADSRLVTLRARNTFILRSSMSNRMLGDEMATLRRAGCIRPKKMGMLIAVCVSVTGCDKDKEQTATKPASSGTSQVGAVKWRGEKKATSLKVGPHDVRIPADWRDAAELDMPGFVGPGVVSMTPASEADGTARIVIVLGWSTLAAGGEIDPKSPPCEAIAAAFGKKYAASVSEIERVTAGTDAGCAWTASNKDLRISTRVRFQEGNQLLVQWSQPAASSVGGTNTKAWTDTLSQLGFAK